MSSNNVHSAEFSPGIRVAGI